MRFTAQEEYGLRCILKLARAANEARGNPAYSGKRLPPAGLPSLTVSDIAQSEGLSEQYAGKLFRILSKSALVESVEYLSRVRESLGAGKE